MKNPINRINFSKIGDRAELPHFLDYQINSYRDFLQSGISKANRKNIGIEQLFNNFFPISSSYGNVKLEYIDYKLEESEFPFNNENESRKRSKTYSDALYLKLKLSDKEGNTIQESWVFLCDLPKMTNKGTFIINGTERVVVSQLHRSPGVFFSKELNNYTGKLLPSARIIPYKGTWLEIEITKDETLQVKIDRKKKMLFSSFVKALGFWKSNLDIMKSFFPKSKVKIDDKESLLGNFIAEDIIDEGTGEVKFEKGTFITLDLCDGLITSSDIKSISVYKVSSELIPLSNTLIADGTKDKAEAAMELFKKVRISDIATAEGAKNFIKKTFFMPGRYNLSNIGRYKINSKLGLSIDESITSLTKEDIQAITLKVIEWRSGNQEDDDIDSLSNRRIRGVGELVSVQFRVGLAKIEHQAREKISMNDPYTVSIQSLLNTKFLYSIIIDFFATGQLSQFMDQTNPLSEVSHKRRISALGPGGLSRANATFDVRDVHSSHYGRLCPVATPEGPNIGIISSLATFGRINKYGFIETPYLKVSKGRVLFDQIDYLNYDDESKHFIAQVNTELDKSGNIISDQVVCRYGAEDKITTVSKDRVDYIDASPKQITSVSAALIPFLAHTDANRALTGSNMQRQAVPLIKTEAPYVATGLERKVAEDSGAIIKAVKDGVVEYVDANKIIVKSGEEKSVYELMGFVRSNHGMSMTQKPIVDCGDIVKAGDVIADGPAVSGGELSIGKNVTIAFMPWGGYNFEDAILISERLVKDDLFTSIHIEEYDVETRSTKLGDEIITRDIPNVSDSAIKDLDENGIIRVGAEVTSGSILVGKITPKGETEPVAEERLLRAIFGAKAREVRDTSLRLSHGAKGVVVDIVELDRDSGDDLPAGVNKIIRVYVAEKRKITVGDKMCGRHGNKGIVSKILPVEDMPFLPDGRAVDVVLNPLGVPSRMNIGQVLEAHLGVAAAELGLYMQTPIFDGAPEDAIKKYLKEAGLAEDGKTILYDGRTGKAFDNRVTVGVIYMLKLHHLVEDKIHARAIGPYSLVTQQPLGGKAQFGGQRLGEMEGWALKAHGAASILQEMLTIKSDDINGRNKAYEAIVKGAPMPEPGAPESFKVLIKELNSLGWAVNLYDKDDNIISTKGEKSKKVGLQGFSLAYLNSDEENS